MTIPVSVIIVTRRAAAVLPRCLAALHDFDEIVIVDTPGDDGTQDIAACFGARYVAYAWDGRYPKKRQWCLDTLSLAHERIFFIDADEVVTPALAHEIAGLDWACAGYFVRGRYMWGERPLRFGLMNNKLALFDRRRVRFPVVDDLDIPGMGEIEGHYQPVPIDPHDRIGQVCAPLLHYAGDDGPAWAVRHENYARWEARMIQRDAYPAETGSRRAALKKIFRSMPARACAAFIHCYLVKGGFLDGRRGFAFARSRYRYYRMVSRALSDANTVPEPHAAAPTSHSAP
jgi:glycosyltransferase involved in cell wall biosynthesis